VASWAALLSQAFIHEYGLMAVQALWCQVAVALM